MAKILVRSIRVRELPPALRDDLDAAPDDEVEVTIDTRTRERNLERLDRIVHPLSEEVRRGGLTEESLPKLLADE
jgi:bifunctional DNA-binding transcriptional regulator/antitoxin component of YhaV-PrlF toxin-antitoxin module